MQEIKISKSRLLEIMKVNREAHINEYNESMTAFRNTAIEQMKKNLKEAQKDGKITLSISVYQPKSHEEDYNTVISMLELSEDDNVTLSYSEFQQYVEDKWGWRGQFDMIASSYGLAGAKGPRGSAGLSGALGDFA